ncbi:MAG: hypothetical protein H0U10_11385, partial [Chloroflexia bacterium]|nr:hypothetical protein [Chloroflexia bacterium]
MAGLVPEAGASRSGDDTRRRGWFWHWNSVVTQYAPLIGLKGVGLLNSYTVWTDRRDESPHRGYAFPSQQSEADFYGEDRAELITINKILVALDLIEIRKEMILKADERGRQWRVPHNFYRVKDHDDGFSLGARDILKVVELADRDAGVYRYVRRVFSGRFAPIGPDNVWLRLLPELRQDPAWTRLAARTAAEEDRASARTRAGHANRKPTAAALALAQADATGPRAVVATPAAANDTVGVATTRVESTSVARCNTGSAVDVGESNSGSTSNPPTSVGERNDGLPSVDHPSNNGRQTAVAPGNTIYDVPFSTTTTTTTNKDGADHTTEPVYADSIANRMPGEVTHGATALPITQPTQAGETTAIGPGYRLAPADGPGEAAATRAFDDANARAATPAERRLLHEL